MYLVLCKDLMFGSRIASTLRAGGKEFTTVFDFNSLSAKCNWETTDVIIDLAELSDVTEAISQIRTEHPHVQVTTFAPHVHLDRLQAAQAAGAQRVLSRGQFDSQLPGLFEG